MTADLKLDDGKVVGTVTNQSDKVLEKPAVVLGSSAQVVAVTSLRGVREDRHRLEPNPFAVAQLSERIVGNAFFDGSGTFDASPSASSSAGRSSTSSRSTRSPASRTSSRGHRADPRVGRTRHPGRDRGPEVPRVGNVLYEIPVTLSVRARPSSAAT